ncbi:MAG: ATP-binding protein, partial [Candidatus Korarchaeota archaeon]|nr:ATP-binding protein [Candidatus Korarchaeota archaeon]
RELSMTVEKAQVEAGTRKLRSRWSLEVAQDLKAMHGLDLEEEMMDVLAYEITAEIDRELINVMRSVAANNASSTT